MHKIALNAIAENKVLLLQFLSNRVEKISFLSISGVYLYLWLDSSNLQLLVKSKNS